MTDEEKQKCLCCANCDIDGKCIAKQEAPFGSLCLVLFTRTTRTSKGD